MHTSLRSRAPLSTASLSSERSSQAWRSFSYLCLSCTSFSWYLDRTTASAEPHAEAAAESAAEPVTTLAPRKASGRRGMTKQLYGGKVYNTLIGLIQLYESAYRQVATTSDPPPSLPPPDELSALRNSAVYSSWAVRGAAGPPGIWGI